LAKEARPNYVVIMADDMGLTDLGCYGGEIGYPLIWIASHKTSYGLPAFITTICEPSRTRPY